MVRLSVLQENDTGAEEVQMRQIEPAETEPSRSASLEDPAAEEDHSLLVGQGEVPETCPDSSPPISCYKPLAFSPTTPSFVNLAHSHALLSHACSISLRSD